MKYYMPTRVFDESSCVLKHASELAALGSRALIVTGRHSAEKCGALQDVIQALQDQGREYYLFQEVEENPSVETIRKAALFGLEKQADFVIGIGGGSPMDAAKAAAFLMKQEYPERADLYDRSAPSVWLPVAEVPTTCGTGSEVTGVAVLTVHEKQTKMSLPQKIFPELALIDGGYLKAAPHTVLVSTSIDALAHMLESCLSSKADDYSRAAALHGLSLWKSCRQLLAGSCDPSPEDYARLMRAATFGGMAIAQTGTSIPHALSYILTYDRKIPHGMAAGYFLPAFLKAADEADRKLLLDTAGFDSCESFTDYIRQVLGDVHVPEETLRRAFGVVRKNTDRMKGCRFNLDEEGLLRICGLEKP